MQEENSKLTEHQTTSIPPSSLKPGKGKLVLVLGLISVLGFPVSFSMFFLLSSLFSHQVLAMFFLLLFPLGFLLGIMATIMGYRELNRIKKGITESSKKKNAITGMVLGVCGWTILPLSAIVLLSMFSGVSISSNKDAMINDLNNIAAHAYQYRLRPASMGGGEGSYRGYAIPAKMSQNENGIYTAHVLHADTLKFIAKSILDSSKTIEMKIDSESPLIATSWIYGGDFK